MSEGRRFCENCGTEVRETTNFCPNCGAAQRLDAEVPTSPPPPNPETGTSSPPPQQSSDSGGSGGSIIKWLVVAIILIIVVSQCARIGNNDSSSSSDKGSSDKEANRAEESASSASSTASSPTSEAEPIYLSGVGQQVAGPFDLESGLAIFNFTHQGQRNFIVGLLDQGGSEVDPVVANAIGPSEVSKAVDIRKADSHVLNANADGPWTIEIEQPRPSSAPSTTSFNGSGDAATSLFQLSRGLHTISFTHQGQRNFIVSLLDKNGKAVDPVVANEIGNSQPSKAVRVPKNDIYLLNVTADGPWTAEIE